MSKVRAAVIGAGSWASMAHLPTLRKRNEVEIVGICRKGDDLLKKLQQEYGSPVATEDYRDIITLNPDIVVVSSPAALHFEHSFAALQNGAHVLCEKPMTINSADAWALVSEAKRVDKELLLSFGFNYMPIVQDLFEILQKRGIGKLEQMSIQMSSQTRELLSNTGSYPGASDEQIPEQATWTNASLSGGGYGQAQLTHALGLAFRLQPQRVQEAFAFMSSKLGAPVELHDAISFKFTEGAIATVSGGSSHLGAWSNRDDLEIRAIGSLGQFLIDVNRECVYICYSDGTEVKMPLRAGAGTYDIFGPANALVEVALGNRSYNRAPGELGALTVEALELAYESASTNSVSHRKNYD